MYKKDTFKNGLRIVTSSMPHMESVSLGLWIGVGGKYEEKRSSGISHLIEHMLFKGTHSRTANVLKEAIEGIGGSFNGFTSEELTCYLVKLPARYIELGLDILSDMVLNPKLDPIELEKEKYVICEEIKMYMDQPGHQVFNILAQAMWPNHALGRPVEGYIDTVKSFKRNDLTGFTNRYYQPANMCIVASGRTDRRKILETAGKIFSMPSARKRFFPESAKKIHKGAHIRLFSKDTKQTHMAFGFHGMKRAHELKYAVRLLNIILGGNMSSRLFERLRERKALCYEIGSTARSYKETGAFIIHAGVDNNKLLEASKEIVNELKELKDNLVTADELYRAKEYYRGQLLLGLEDTSSRMLWLGDRIMNEGKAPAIREIFRDIEKVSARDIKEVVRCIFNGKNLNFATVGPVRAGDKNKLRKALRL